MKTIGFGHYSHVMSGVALALGSVAVGLSVVWATIELRLSAAAVAVVVLAGFAATFVRMPSLAEGRAWTSAPLLVLAVGLLGTPQFPGGAAVIAGVAVAATARRRTGHIQGQVIAGSVVFVLLWLFHRAGAVPLAESHFGTGELFVVGVVGLGWFVVEALIHASSAERWPEARRYHLGRAVADWMMGLVAVSSAATLAVLWPYSRPWAIAVSLGPFVIALHLGAQMAKGRATASQTVQALGRLPEAAGLSKSGHSRGVADLATAMGKVTGLIGPQLRELEIAANLHDIGLLATTTDPIQGHGFFSSDIARWSADMLRRSDTLHPAAAIVSRSAEPFRSPGLDPDPTLDERSQIVQVACTFVRMIEAGAHIDDAVESLYQHSLYQFDPAVVALVRPAVTISDTVLDELARRRR